MSLIDRDLIMRQLRFLQQLLARAKKAEAENDFLAALDVLHGGYREALGLPHELIARVDISSALLMLRTRERQSAYLELLQAEAQVLTAQGDAAAARAVTRRATELAAALPR